MVPWYVLEDGRVVPPGEITLDVLGVRRHTSGVAVGMSGDVPHVRYVEPDDIAKPKDEKPLVEAKPPGHDDEAKKKLAAAKEVKPEEPKHGYVTRETKPVPGSERGGR